MKDEDYAIVFSGGGALGSWEVGCLKAILEHHEGRLPKIVTGASAGAINAAALCAQMTVEEIGELWEGLSNADVYKLRPFRAKLLAAALGVISFKGAMPSIVKQLRAIDSIYDTSPLENTLKEILEEKQHQFLSSDMAFAISTTIVASSLPELFYKTGPGTVLPPAAMNDPRFGKYWTEVKGLALLLQALKGTSALPMLFPPMEGRFDGGVMLNQPISPAILLGATNIYVLVPSVEQFGDTRDIVALGSSVLTLWLSMSLTAQIRHIKLRNEIRKLVGDPPLRVCVVRPPLDLGVKPGVGLLSFGLKVSELIENGEKSAKSRLTLFKPNNENTWY